MSDITIHLGEMLDTLSLHAIQHELLRVEGISRVELNETHPQLMVVCYDQTLLDSRAILASFTSQGLEAELIGF